MKKYKLENKLKLWDTPGFLDFLDDLREQIRECNIGGSYIVLKRLYKAELEKINEKESKYKQGKLGL